jgi:hypothetical protein
MTPNWFVVPAAALVLGVAVLSPTPSQAAPSPGFSGQQYGWDVPPEEYNEVQRRGFHDGVQGAQKDYDHRRRPDVDNRDEYRHPDDVHGGLRQAYREGFRRGYEQASSHLWGGPPMRDLPPGWDPNYRWDTSGLESDIARQGFHDGIEGAKKDYGNGRNPDVHNRDEYRDPSVPEGYRHDYRAGFRRGYDAAARRLWGPA